MPDINTHLKIYEQTNEEFVKYLESIGFSHLRNISNHTHCYTKKILDGKVILNVGTGPLTEVEISNFSQGHLRLIIRVIIAPNEVSTLNAVVDRQDLKAALETFVGLFTPSLNKET